MTNKTSHYHVTYRTSNNEVETRAFLFAKTPKKALQWAYWLATKNWAHDVIVWDGRVGSVRLATIKAMAA